MFNWDDPLADANPSNQDAIANIPPASLSAEEISPVEAEAPTTLTPAPFVPETDAGATGLEDIEMTRRSSIVALTLIS